MSKIAPLDLAQCQTEIVVTHNEPFRIGATPTRRRERCPEKPTHILREVGDEGQMTVCDSCLAVFKKQFAGQLDQYTIEQI